MTPEEACKIVAYFDGYRDAFNPCGGDFENHFQINKFLSLDELTPVWEKLGYRGFHSDRFLHKEKMHYQAWLTFFDERTPTQISMKSIREAAVIATAKAIQELEDDVS